MTSTALAESRTATAASAADALWTVQQQQAIRSLLVPSGKDGRPLPVSDAQLALFGEICARTQLDPFVRQIYLIPTSRGLVVHIGIDGLRAIAARSGRLIGSATYWKCTGGDWQDCWTEATPPDAALCVGRTGDGGEFRAVVTWREFCRVVDGRAVGQWHDRPANQLGVTAERHMLRKACPYELAGAASQVQAAGGVVSVTEEEPELPSPAGRPALGDDPEPGQQVPDDELAQALGLWQDACEWATQVGVTHRDLPDGANPALIRRWTDKLSEACRVEEADRRAGSPLA